LLRIRDNKYEKQIFVNIEQREQGLEPHLPTFDSAHDEILQTKIKSDFIALSPRLADKFQGILNYEKVSRY